MKEETYLDLDYDKTNVWHVYPVGDLKPHVTRVPICHCNPKLQVQDNGGLVVTHNSYDGREMEEYGRKPN